MTIVGKERIFQDAWARVACSDANECWLWPGWTNEQGYACIDARGRGFSIIRVHRLFYEFMCGPIEDGLVVDHLCHNKDSLCPGGSACKHRRCVNPEHLELTTIGENARRGKQDRIATCSKGHVLTYSRPTTGHRQCRVCDRDARRRRSSGPRNALGVSDIPKMREMISSGAFSKRAIGREFGVSRWIVDRVASGSLTELDIRVRSNGMWVPYREIVDRES